MDLLFLSVCRLLGRQPPVAHQSFLPYCSAMSTAMLQSDLPFPVRRGKVRDVYDLGEALLIIATDRISAFDVVMPNGIPDKGRILTGLSLFWFRKFQQSFENHLIASELHDYPANVRPFASPL